ncbi:hypothetical protein A0J61_05477 [Choanephora cucurbitarum]|uniref:Uncharacterized protein n=1 Tax=Choanephora cucurbitarum TaxID=101091 RepID=A0A1C7NBX5_9FUNG|nr:hypothetical protein A0J61_05477 [Choanephora cucurbitarum]
MIVDDNDAANKRLDRRRRRRGSSIDSISSTILSHLTSKQPAHVETVSNTSYISHDTQITPPSSRPASPTSDLCRSDDDYPALSLNNTGHTHQADVVKVTSRSLPTNNNQTNGSSETPHSNNKSHSLTLHHHLNPFKFYKHFTEEEGAYECRLTMPIVVTSREEYSEGSPPALPEYDVAANQPPDYNATIQSLPPVPVYAPPN